MYYIYISHTLYTTHNMSVNLEYNKFHTWFHQRFPRCYLVDKNFTFLKYNFPDYVQSYIINNWVKISDDGGGTFCEPTMYKKKYPNSTPQ
jgi:hypothetical protein